MESEQNFLPSQMEPDTMKSDRISNYLRNFANEIGIGAHKFETENLPKAFLDAQQHNKWFTKNNILTAMNYWADKLANKAEVELWLGKYAEPDSYSEKKILLILAGNIPAVGFHDVLCTLLSGHRAEIKLSSDDRFLIPWLLEKLSDIIPQWKNRYQFHQGLIKDFDAVIATGSNQSAKTFESYFSNKPRIIRHNRSSIAVIHSDDSNENLQQLANDVFLYFGLGCRNVTTILLPVNFDKQRLFDAFLPWNHLGQHNAFANNHDYYNGYFSLTNEELLDGGFYLLRKHAGIHAPLSVINFQEYSSDEQAIAFITANSNDIQCIVSSKNIVDGTVMPGQAQFPALGEYADGVDTMKFLLQQ